MSPELAPLGWRPVYLDYLHLGFTNATAFSPTDVMPLTHRAKYTMMIQSTIALALFGLTSPELSTPSREPARCSHSVAGKVAIHTMAPGNVTSPDALQGCCLQCATVDAVVSGRMHGSTAVNGDRHD